MEPQATDHLPEKPARLTRNQRLTRKAGRLIDQIKKLEAQLTERNGNTNTQLEDFVIELLVAVDTLVKFAPPVLLASLMGLINERRKKLGFPMPGQTE